MKEVAIVVAVEEDVTLDEIQLQIAIDCYFVGVFVLEVEELG